MSNRPLFLVAAILFSFAWTSPAAAGKSGSSLDLATVPAGKLSLQMKSSLIDSGNFGSDGDPRCDAIGGGGGSLRINGGPGNDLTIDLPCAGWRSPNGSASQVNNTDYVYQDKSGATCSKIVVKHGRSITAKCRGAQVVYTLGAPQGDIDVTLRLGSAPLRNCVTFGPAPTKVQRDGSDGKRYRAKDAPTPAASCTSP